MYHSSSFQFFFCLRWRFPPSTLRFYSITVYTMILQAAAHQDQCGRYRIRTQDLQYVPEVWCATIEPPHLLICYSHTMAIGHKGIYKWDLGKTRGEKYKNPKCHATEKSKIPFIFLYFGVDPVRKDDFPVENLLWKFMISARIMCVFLA